VTNNTTGTDAEVGAKKKRRSSAGEQHAKQEDLPLHVIKRSLPLNIRSADPAQCLDQIDRMYNIYYELEVGNQKLQG
jgi:hypothetical protein